MVIGFAEMLVDAGIDSISLNPDSVLKVRQRLAVHEKKSMKEGGVKSSDVKTAAHIKTEKKGSTAQ